MWSQADVGWKTGSCPGSRVLLLLGVTVPLWVSVVLSVKWIKRQPFGVGKQVVGTPCTEPGSRWAMLGLQKRGFLLVLVSWPRSRGSGSLQVLHLVRRAGPALGGPLPWMPCEVDQPSSSTWRHPCKM